MVSYGRVELTGINLIGYVISVPVHFHLKKSKMTRKLSRHAQCKVDSVFSHTPGHSYRFRVDG